MLFRSKTNNFIDLDLSSIQISPSEFSAEGNELRPIVSRNTLKSQLSPAINITDETLDLSTNYELLDSNVQKTGKFVTLKYNSVGWIEQAFATTMENVNPYHILEYIGNIKLTPEEDSWVRTVELPNRQVSVDVNLNIDLGTIQVPDVTIEGAVIYGPGGTRRHDIVYDPAIDRQLVVKKTDTSKNVATSRIFLGSNVDDYMRSRNTEFSVSGLKAKTRFYHFLDGNSSVDFIPKLVEISKDSTLQNYGSTNQFEAGETVIGT